MLHPPVGDALSPVLCAFYVLVHLVLLPFEYVPQLYVKGAQLDELHADIIVQLFLLPKSFLLHKVLLNVGDDN